MTVTTKEKTIAEYEASVYFNLVHNLIWNQVNPDNYRKPTTKSAPVKVGFFPTEEQEDHLQKYVPVETFDDAIFKFGNREFKWSEVFALLREHYEIAEDTKCLVRMDYTGWLPSPVGMNFKLKYSEEI